MTGSVGTPVSYAPHVEFGTVKMKAQSFLRAAIDLRKEDVKLAFKQALRRALGGK